MPQRLLTFVILVSSTQFLKAQDKVENPEFLSWSKVSAKTTLTFRATQTTGGTTTILEQTRTLIEVRPNEVVVELGNLVTKNGMQTIQPVRNFTVPRFVPLPKGVTPKEFAAGNPVGAKEHPPQRRKVGDVEYNVRRYTHVKDAEEGHVETTMWLSDEIPGRIVRMEVRQTRDGKMTTAVEERVGVKKP